MGKTQQRKAEIPVSSTQSGKEATGFRISDCNDGEKVALDKFVETSWFHSSEVI